MSAYRATATRDGAFWLVEVDGVGVTQGRNLADAQHMARDLVSIMTEEDDVEVEFIVELESDRTAQIARTRDLTAAAEASQREAADATRALVAELRASGVTGKDVAWLLGVSEQRVSQLAATAASGRSAAAGKVPVQERKAKVRRAVKVEKMRKIETLGKAEKTTARGSSKKIRTSAGR